MNASIISDPVLARQYPASLPTRTVGAGATTTPRQSNIRLTADKCHYRAGTNPLYGGDHSFGHARQLSVSRSKILDLLDIDERRAVARIAALVTIRRRALDILLYCRTALYQAVAPVIIAGLLSAGPLPVALLPERAVGVPSIVAPLIEAAKRKQLTQEVDMVVTNQTPILPATPAPAAIAATPRFWAGRSTTPDCPTTVDIVGMSARASAARKAYGIERGSAKVYIPPVVM